MRTSTQATVTTATRTKLLTGSRKAPDTSSVRGLLRLIAMKRSPPRVMCTDHMDNDRAPVPENLVLQENERQITSWNDHRGRLTFRTLFSADSTATERLVTGVAELPEDGFLALHRHEQAETYYVLSGEGVVTLGGTEYRVSPGSSVFIPGSSEHGLRNAGSQTLRFFYTLAADAFSDIEYVFS